jgi:hypothetical protein
MIGLFSSKGKAIFCFIAYDFPKTGVMLILVPKLDRISKIGKTVFKIMWQKIIFYFAIPLCFAKFAAILHKI